MTNLHRRFALLAGCAVALGCGTTYPPAAAPKGKPDAAHKTADPSKDADGYDRPVAPPLSGGVWLNTDKPLRLKQLRGHIVLLDFWTYCCINCMHVLPELERIEKRFAGKPVVIIGVHSGKFDAEKDPARIRQAIGRYGITHPVVVDSSFSIWKRYHVSGWPTLVLIDTDGRIASASSGEPKRGMIGDVIQLMLDRAKKRGTLAKHPVRIKVPKQADTGPLAYPGKVAVAANGHIAIADSNHHRILIVAATGKQLAAIGSGIQGSVDGDFAAAAFNRPHGLVFGDHGRTLYVADTENHELRRIDLVKRRVTTIAGTGFKGRGDKDHGPATSVALRSPWALALRGNDLYVAMAGAHQIWRYDIKAKTIGVFAGSGTENIMDGDAATAAFSQPSGLSLRGDTLYVADSEVSAVRAIDLRSKRVRTLVGTGLFDFGDTDGAGDKVRLQHALGIVATRGGVYVADTYNNKIKRLDPKTRRMTTVVGSPDAKKTLFEPGGIAALANGRLLVADTNNHRLRIVDPSKHTITTLKLRGVTKPPALGLTMAPGHKAKTRAAPALELRARGAVGRAGGVLDVMPLAPSIGKLSPGAPAVVEVVSQKGIRFIRTKLRTQLDPFHLPLKLPLRVDKGARAGRAVIDLSFFWCRKDGTACVPASVRLDVAIRVDGKANSGHAGVSYRAPMR